MKSIIKKELKSMSVAPAYYIILAVFISVLNFLFLKGFFLDGIMNFRGYLGLSLWFFVVFIPAIAMRTVSEEIKTGTLEFLLTKPLKLRDIILGKYSALLVYFAVFFVAMIVLYLSLSILGSFPGGIFISQFIGTVLLVAAMFAVSLFASSLTKNQIFAFLLGVFLNFLLIIVGSPIVTLSAPLIIAPILRGVSYMGHIENFSQGILSLTDIFYFFSVIAVALSFAFAHIVRYQRTGSLSFSLSSMTRPLALLSVLILLNWALSFTHLTLDTTTARVNSLSPNSTSLLAEVTEPVTVTLYSSEPLPAELGILRTQFRDMVSQFGQYASGNITLTEVFTDTDEREKKALDAGIPSIQIQTLKNDQFATQKWYLGAVIQKGENKEIIPYIGNEKNLEYSLVSKIVKITRTNTPSATLVTSADIPEKVTSAITQILRETVRINAFPVKEDTKELPKDANILLVIEWDTPFPSVINTQIQERLESQSVVYFFQPVRFNNADFTATMSPSENAKKILEKLQLTLGEGIASDAQNANSINMTQWPITFPVMYPFFPRVAYDFTGSGQPGIVNLPFPASLIGEGKDILQTSAYGFIRKDLTSLKPENIGQVSKSDLGQFTIAKLIEKWDKKIAVIPNVALFTLVSEQMLPTNIAFVADLIDHISGDERLMGIRGKTLEYQSFTQDTFKNSLIRGLNVYALPILILFTWITIAWIRNRRRGG